MTVSSSMAWLPNPTRRQNGAAQSLYLAIPVVMLLVTYLLYSATDVKLLPSSSCDTEEAQVGHSLDRVRQFGKSFPRPRQIGSTAGSGTDEWWEQHEDEDRTAFDWLQTEWMLSLSVSDRCHLDHTDRFAVAILRVSRVCYPYSYV